MENHAEDRPRTAATLDDAWYQVLVETAPDGIVATRPDGVIVIVNAQLCKMFGYSRDELLGSSVERLVPRRVRSGHAAVRTAYAASPSARPMGSGLRLRGERADGTEFPVDISIAPIRNGPGGEVLTVAVVRDVSLREEQKKLLEEALEAAERASEQARAATAAKSLFLANMSHEIRTPLNAIVGLAHLLARTGLTEQQDNWVRKLGRAGSTLLEIVNDLLDLSKIEAGRLRIETTDFSLEDVVEDALVSVRERAREKGLELMVNIDNRLSHRLLGDPLRITQILTNLLSNAVKFTERGHVVLRIEDASTEPGGRASDSARPPRAVWLRIVVEDTGIGMAPEHLTHLFEPFTQADGTTTRRFGGTGLGLSITRSLVELMDGSIDVTSRLGEGTTFTVRVRVEDDDHGGSRRLPEELRELRVLIVDDNDTARRILASLVESMGLAWETSPSAASGLERLRTANRPDSGERPFDVLLVDWRMPERDGLEALRDVRGDSGIRPQPHAILTTAFGRDDLRERGMEAGADGFLPKPINASALFDLFVDLFATTSSSRRSAPPSTEHPSRHSPPRLEDVRVLVAEDQAINREIVSEVLRAEGAIVLLAKNGEEAVQRAREDLPDVVLMDVQMPLVDGLEATRRLRAERDTARLPIIAMTAHALDAERRRCLEAGMDAHIPKPFDPERLVATIRRNVRTPPRPPTHALSPATKPEPEPSTQAGTHAATDLLARLADLPGFAHREGLRRLGGDRLRYERFVRHFSSEARTLLPRLMRDPPDDDLAALAHSIRGAAANLGFDRIARWAAEVEAEPEFATAQTLVEHLRELLLRVESTPDTASLSSASSASDDGCAPPAWNAVRELHERLGRADGDTGWWMEENAETLLPCLGAESLDAIRGRVDVFDHEGAARTLRARLAQLGRSLASPGTSEDDRP